MKILIVHKQVLFPRDTGGKIRVLNVLQHLVKRHPVTYVCNLRENEEQHVARMRDLGLRVETVPYKISKHGSPKFLISAALNLFSPRPFSVERNFDPNLRARVAAELTAEPYDVLICDTVQMFRHMQGLRAKVNILFQHNFEAQILQRHAQVGPNPLFRAYMWTDWKKMLRFERDCGKEFDRVIAVSEPDKKLFEREYGWNNVSCIDTAVDADFFQNRDGQEVPDRVVFVGSMDWLPNQDGVKFFVRDIWPKIRAARPQATFQIVGRNPPPSVTALTSVPGVEVVGFVPDVRPYLSSAAAFVVPLLVGGGTRLKIYEAMAMGRAVVSTRVGAEGLPLTPGQHFFEEDDPSRFADAVVRLLSDQTVRGKMGQAAEQFVRSKYDSETISRQFEEICLETLAQKAAQAGRPQPQSVA
ncbi:MAG: glycosyltransferase [Planctomycetes bacterium]|nr:glycosyltransferase [Planctomycetota bacterium]